MEEEHQSDATGWLQKVASTMWTILRLQWKARKSKIHKGKKADNYRIQRQQFLNRIMHVQGRGECAHTRQGTIHTGSSTL
eukprot:5315740-Ditylum_brightwellii.AAC.1